MAEVLESMSNPIFSYIAQCRVSHMIFLTHFDFFPFFIYFRCPIVEIRAGELNFSVSIVVGSVGQMQGLLSSTSSYKLPCPSFKFIYYICRLSQAHHKPAAGVQSFQGHYDIG